MSATSTGSATITTATRKMITQLWRIIWVIFQQKKN
jgi:hypothetical protein